MEEVLINSDLVIKGNLILGDDGSVRARDAVAYCKNDKEAFEKIVQKLGSNYNTTVSSPSIVESDYNISGKTLNVYGTVLVLGEIKCGDSNWRGKLTCNQGVLKP